MFYAEGFSPVTRRDGRVCLLEDGRLQLGRLESKMHIAPRFLLYVREYVHSSSSIQMPRDWKGLATPELGETSNGSDLSVD